MLKKIIPYCPFCRIGHRLKRTDSIFVSRECSEHQTKFVPTGTGIKVPKNFLDKFQEMTRPVALSSQEI